MGESELCIDYDVSYIFIIASRFTIVHVRCIVTRRPCEFDMLPSRLFLILPFTFFLLEVALYKTLVSYYPL